MSSKEFYRGGTRMKPRPRDVEVDLATGLVQPTRGISVFDRPDGLNRFGGAYRVTDVPAELQIIQIGHDPSHHEIVPAFAMTQKEYEDALGKIVLVPIKP